MIERDLVKRFIQGINTYPFKTHIEKEVHVSGGRADIRLPDYNVVIEAKGPNGSAKSAIGQVIYYAEELEDTPYILLPADSITNTTKAVCEKRNIGILTASLVPRMVYDVGGLEAFSMYEYEGSAKSADFENKDHKALVVGSNEKIKW
jgi:Fe-S cluster assembly ATPase SufC